MDYKIKRWITYILLLFIYILLSAFLVEKVNYYMLNYLLAMLIFTIEFYFYWHYGKRNKLHTALFIIVLSLFYGVFLYLIVKNNLFL